MAGNNKSDSPRWVDVGEVVHTIRQEIAAINQTRMQLSFLNEMDEIGEVDMVTKVADLHLSDKQQMLSKIEKRIKKLPYER